MRVFNALRFELLGKSKLGRYLLYALGETILVVIGILIALWVNRQNEESKRIEETEVAAQMVLVQMRKDVTEIESLLETWRNEQKVADTILRLTKKGEPITKTCRVCPNLLTGASLPTLTDRIPKTIAGKTFHEGELLDALVDVEFHYLEGLKMVAFHENSVVEFTTENLKYWQDNYDWFADLSGRGRCPDDCIKYFFESEDYRNRVAFYELILLDSYYAQIDEFKDETQTLIERLETLL